MADQATMNGRRWVPINSPATVMIENVAEFGNDIATLAELQGKLAAADAQEAKRRVTFPALMIVVSALVLLGSVPVLLTGIAALIAPMLGVEGALASFGAAMLIVGAVALVLFGLVAWLALRSLGPRLSTFQRSREELRRNIAWVRSVLLHGSAPPSGTRRG